MKRIVLIEDDESIVNMIVRRLKKAGYDIHTAGDGKVGVEMALNLMPDLILMDMHMPVMDGYGATRTLRHMGYEGLICALTASASPGESKRSMDAGCDYFIPKPVGLDFEDRVRKILEDAKSNLPERMPSENEGSVVRAGTDLKEIMPAFFETRRKDIAAIHMALEGCDYETVRLRGHSMKGAGSGYGFEAITDMGKEIEEAAKARDREKILTMVNKLSAYLERVEVVYE